MHNVPDWMSSRAGPFDLWPTGLGFEYFYGFLGGDADQWHTPIFENNVPIESEEQVKGSKHFAELMTDKAISWMRTQHSLAPTKPWLLYFATGLAHAPHHAPKDWIDKYKGQFDQGWTRCARRRSPARSSRASCRPARSSASDPSRSPPGTACRPTRSGSLRV